MSRKFYLVDSIGRERSLQSDIEFMWEPSGLGFAENREYSQVEYGFFVESSKDFEQPEVAGTLVFWSKKQDPYQTYHEFMDWVQGAKDLQLKYVPYPGRELYLDVNVDGLELSEKTLYGVLECPVIFRGTSPYHKKNPLTFLFRTEDNRNPMRFPFEFPFRFSDGGAGDAQVFTPAGHFPAAMELTINGPVSNIYFKCEDAATGEMIGVLDLSGVSVAEGDHIYYSSRPNADGVWKVSGNTRTDLVEALNENEANFFTLPVGKEIKATLTADTQPTFAKITRIGGNSVQETSVQGKNRIDIDAPMEARTGWEHTANGLKLTASSTVSLIKYDLKKFISKPGKYTWSYKVTASGTGSVSFYTEYLIDGNIAGAGSTMISQEGTFERAVTFTVSDSSLTQPDCLIYLAGSTDGNVVYTVELIMLEEGSAASNYEPFTPDMPSPEHPSEIKSAGDSGSVDIAVNGTNVLNIPVDDPLRAIVDADGNIVAQDYIDVEAGEIVRVIKEIEVPDATSGATMVYDDCFLLQNGNVLIGRLEGVNDCACSHFVYDQNHMYHVGSFRVNANPVNNTWLYMTLSYGTVGLSSGATKEECTAAFNTWKAAQKAAGTPVMVQYELGEPVRTPITIDTTISTRTGTNTVTTSGSVPARLEVSAGGKMYSGETVSFEVEPITHILQVHEYYKG